METSILTESTVYAVYPADDPRVRVEFAKYGVDRTYGNSYAVFVNDRATNNPVCMFTLNIMSPWCEMYDLKRHPTASMTHNGKIMTYVNTIFHKHAFDTTYYIWLGTFEERLVSYYERSGYAVVYGRNESTYSPLGIAPGRPFTSLIYSKRAYDSVRTPVTSLHRNIPFQFGLTPADVRFVVHELVLNPKVTEVPLVMYANKLRRPELAWYGDYFMPSGGTLNIFYGDVVASHVRRNAIVGLAPPPVEANRYITGHTHPIIMYASHNVIIGPPSDGDYYALLLNQSIASCVFAVEGMYVMQLKRRPSARDIQTVWSERNRKEYYAEYGAVIQSLREIEAASGLAAALEHRAQGIYRLLSYIQTSPVASFLSVVFYPYVPAASADSYTDIYPSTIQIDSLPDPVKNLQYTTAGDKFYSLSESNIAEHTMPIPNVGKFETRLAELRAYLKPLTVDETRRAFMSAQRPPMAMNLDEL